MWKNLPDNKERDIEDYWKDFRSDKNDKKPLATYSYKKGGTKRSERRALAYLSSHLVEIRKDLDGDGLIEDNEIVNPIEQNVRRAVRYLTVTSLQVSANPSHQWRRSYQAKRFSSVVEAMREDSTVSMDMDGIMNLFLGDLDFDAMIENPSIAAHTWKQMEKDQKYIGKGALMEGQTVAMYHKAKQFIELQMGDIDETTIQKAVVQSIINLVSLLQANPQALKEEGDKLGYIGIKKIFDKVEVAKNPIDTPEELLDLFQKHPQVFLFLRDLFASNPEYAFYMMIQ